MASPDPLSKPVMTLPFPWPVPNPGDVSRSQHGSKPWSSLSAPSHPPDFLGSVSPEPPLPNCKGHMTSVRVEKRPPISLEVSGQHSLTCTPTFSSQMLLTKSPLPKYSLLQRHFYILEITGGVQKVWNWFWDISFKKLHIWSDSYNIVICYLSYHSI